MSESLFLQAVVAQQNLSGGRQRTLKDQYGFNKRGHIRILAHFYPLETFPNTGLPRAKH